MRIVWLVLDGIKVIDYVEVVQLKSALVWTRGPPTATVITARC